MKGKRTQGVLFLFWIILAILSTFWIVFILVNYLHLVLTLLIFQFVFILSYITLIIAVIDIYEILTNGNNIFNKREQREKNIEDIYRYQQLLNPPDSDMYN